MKRAILVLAVALIAGVTAFSLMRSHKTGGSHGTLLDTMPELGWLRSELDLTDSQFTKVGELHAAYRPKCVGMCDRIEKAHERLDALARAGGQVSPELKAAIADHARIHAECQEAMIEHLYRTADVLDEEQAKRYLDTMLPFALDFSHSEPKGVHGH